MDEPAAKATFTVVLIVLAHHTAISNMPESSSAHVAGGKKKVSGCEIGSGCESGQYEYYIK